MRIGPYVLDPPLLLAPMAGVTDQPFRLLCRQFGAALASGEMSASDPGLWHTEKSALRSRLDADPEPRTIQIVGSDPRVMAAAARHYVQLGAQIIDINMGCPAKKVCRKLAGSALLGDEGLVRDILLATVEAVAAPVTLKMRTGLDPESRNALAIARIAEQSGIRALAIHGRTRDCRFSGRAEYETIRRVKLECGIPVIANGDLGSVQEVEKVLEFTQVDGVMIGRAALGQPWLFAQLKSFLQADGRQSDAPERGYWMIRHLLSIHRFYGEGKGVLIARKHLGWYAERLGEAAQAMRQHFIRLGSAAEQIRLVEQFFQTPYAFQQRGLKA